MKAYCANCGTHEASFRLGNDAKTGEPFEDLCCDGCHLVIATVSERIPLGWKLVPMEVTPAMTAAAAATPGVKAIDGASQVHQARGYPLPAEAFAEGSALEQAWRAMLAAAPEEAP